MLFTKRISCRWINPSPPGELSDAWSNVCRPPWQQMIASGCWIVTLSFVFVVIARSSWGREVGTGRKSTDRPQFQQQFDQLAAITWFGMPLGRGVKALAQAYHIAIRLDRRVDPNQPLDLTLSPQPLRNLLETVAGSKDLGVSFLGRLVYIGPKPAAARLRTLARMRAQDIELLPAESRRRLRAERPWQWDDLATPRELLDQLATQGKVSIGQASLVPHDLWRSAQLPPLPWSDRLTLIANEFDLTFEIQPDGQSIALVPVPMQISITRSFRVGPRAAVLAARYADDFPGAKLTADGDKLILVGRVEDEEKLAAIVSGAAKPKSVATGGRVYELSVENVAVSKLLAHFERALGLTLKIDKTGIKRAGLNLDALVTVKVKNASLDELLTAALTPAHLSYTRDEKIVYVRPADRGRPNP